VFDYFPEEVPPDEPGLCSGSINPSEFSGENVTVFVSHEHRDHYSSEVFAWRDRNPKTRYVFGFLPNTEATVEVIPPRETRMVDGMKVTTIRSNDTGVGFVVEVDGLVLFHAGDHANRVRDLTGNYTPEIEFLKSSGLRPDIAMLPISGCGFGDPVAVRIGTEYALDQLLPALFIPMHNGSFGPQYAPFIADCQGRHPGVRMESLECRGDHVRYRKSAAS
jgi:L-ascorbate metabolism protein UlaG (beta-lactamase superfamily)